MNLQYIYDDSTDPATQSVLQYAVNPDTVFVSTGTQQMYADLTITVFNPQSQAVVCRMFQFGFLVGAADGDLTTEATGIETASDQSNWTISAQATESPDTPTLYQFSVPAAGMANQTLNPQQSLVFHLNEIEINEAVGEGGAPIYITEVTGSDNFVQGEITISKAEPTLSIQQFDVSPPTPVAPGTSIELQWSLTNSDHWQLYNVSTATLLFDSDTDSPPNPNSYTDNPEQTTTYELIAWAGQLFTAQQATAMVSAPTISVSPPSVTVNALAQVTINWTAQNAQTVTISPPPAAGSATVPAGGGQGSFVVQPGANTTYTLYATGPNNTNSQPQYVIVNINPASITSFAASPAWCSQGQSVNLSWQTQSATSAELSQSILGSSSIINLGVVGLSSTGYSVKPTGISTYMLAAQNVSSEPAYEQAGVAALAAVVSLKASPVALAFDGISVWAVLAGGLVTQIPIVSPNTTNTYSLFDSANGAVWYANGIIFTVAGINDVLYWSLYEIDGKLYPMLLPAYSGGSSSQTALGLYSDGHSLWAPLTNNGLVMLSQEGSVSTAEVWKSGIGDGPCVLISDGTNLWTANTTKNTVWQMNTSNPAGLLSTVNVQSPCALLFDGTYVWIATNDTAVSSSYNITKLLAQNASIQGQYKVAVGPFALGFDGTNLWVASADNTVTVMTPNGTVQATFQLAGGPSAFLFDGTNMWVALKAGNQVAQIVIKGSFAQRATEAKEDSPESETEKKGKDD
jgi:hypothetical protein